MNTPEQEAMFFRMTEAIEAAKAALASLVSVSQGRLIDVAILSAIGNSAGGKASKRKAESAGAWAIRLQHECNLLLQVLSGRLDVEYDGDRPSLCRLSPEMLVTNPAMAAADGRPLTADERERLTQWYDATIPDIRPESDE